MLPWASHSPLAAWGLASTSPPPRITILRSGDNEAAFDGDLSGTSGTGAAVARSNVDPIEGAWSVTHHCGPSASGGDLIARRFIWANPGGAVENGVIAGLGDELWWGAWYEFNGAEPHDYTHIHRMARIAPGQFCVLQATFESAADTLRVDLEDYGGTSTGVANKNHFSGVSVPVDEPFYLELGAFLSNDPLVGWCELKINGELIGHSVGRTLKLATNDYRHLQLGLGNYHANVAGREATIKTDDWYIALGGPRGPS